MPEIENLIVYSDYFLLLPYAVLFFFIMKYFIFKNLDSQGYRLLALFLTCKVLFVIIHALMVVYVWKLADSLYVYLESQNLVNLIKADFSNIKYLFTPAESYVHYLSSDHSVKGAIGSGSENNFFLTRFCTILYPFAFGKYLLISFGYCAVSTVAIFKLYLVLIKIYPHIKRGIALCLLFLPTVLMYGSPIYKETLCFAAMCFAASNLYNITRKEAVYTNVFFLGLNIFFIALLKPYVIFAILFSLFLAILIGILHKVYRKNIIGKIFTFGIILGIVFLLITYISDFDPYIVEFVDASNMYQNLYNDGSSMASFEIGEIQSTFWGILSKSPLGFYTTYFRPNLWEAKNLVLLFSALEAFALLMMVLYSLFKRGKYLFALLRESFISRILFLYIIIMGMIIGLTTFNFGTLIRYKVPVVPFLWIFALLLSNYRKEKTAGGKA